MNENKINKSFLLASFPADEGETISLIDASESNKNIIIPENLPVLPVRNTVLFPGVVIPVTVGREKSIKLVKKANKGDKTIGVITQMMPATEDATSSNIYQIGTLARILKLLVLPDGNTTVIIQGISRFEVKSYTQTEPYITAQIGVLKENFPTKLNKENKMLFESIRENARKILKLNPEIPRDAHYALDNIEGNDFLINFLASNVNVEVGEKQKLLEINDGVERAHLLLEFLLKDIQLLELKREIQSKAHTDIDQQQRDYFLRQQMKVLQDELGNESSEKQIDELRTRSKSKKWDENVAKIFNKELDKAQRMNNMSPEFPIAMNYLEYLLDLPWNEYTKDNFDLKRAKKILDSEHSGLEKVKERILEYLAVLKLKNDMKAPILCLYGPPGVGKTSLGRSIAKAINRKYVRMSLGGLHDEAEIRGHRKTYIGSMPGKIVQHLKKAQSSNPVFVLDEIDKIGNDFRGDPSSALLEVLDPEQNIEFLDNYIDINFDLSKVMFVATANSLDTIQPALRDRMEIIDLSGYTVEEKVDIAKKHLVPKQKKENGLLEKDFVLPEKSIQKLIEAYTRESGVRQLERQIGKVCRKIAKAKATEEAFPKNITTDDVVKMMGMEIFDNDSYQGNELAGIVTGLAWTQVGGEILMIETSLSRGKGKLTISGQLGDVMKESAMAALSYLKANAEDLNIDYRVFDHYDLHIHVPAGAVPKDGPSAGITMLTSLASAFTQRKVKAKTAMTGEITLRGKVLPVGGLKEKILAAKRAGIQDIIMCYKNRKDIEEVNQEYVKGLTFHYVSQAEEVLEIALLKEKIAKPIQFIIPEEKKTEV
ncbi:MAG: endopeptidase La [Cytophagales bacterium]|nr:MAG: endopeptidase La [Cytophagales bacterium]